MTTIAVAPADARTDASPLRRLAREVFRRQPELATAAELCLLGAVPVLLAVLIDDRQVNDVNIWLKPLKFFLSLAIYFVTLAWFHGYLSEEVRSRRLGRILVGVPIGVGLLEMTWLLATAAVGQPSHFNRSAAIYAVSYSLAGVGATLLVVAALATAILVGRARTPSPPPALRLAIVLGAVIAFVGTMVTAGFLASGSGHWVGGIHTDAGGLPLLGWSRTGGDLRTAHFFSLHALQAVPLVGWAATRWEGERARVVVWVGAALYAGWIAFTFAQALAGRPLI
jgi:uncharacterized membrane protein (DUF485 family)